MRLEGKEICKAKKESREIVPHREKPFSFLQFFACSYRKGHIPCLEKGECIFLIQHPIRRGIVFHTYVRWGLT